MKGTAVFSCATGVLIITHGEVFFYEDDAGVFSFYDEDEKKRNLWLEVAAGRFKPSRSWTRLL